MEMIRRFIWNFIRVDREIVFNKQSFGFIKDIASILNQLPTPCGIESLKKQISRKLSSNSDSSFSIEDLLKSEKTEDFANLKLHQKNMENDDDSKDEGELELVDLKNKNLKFDSEDVEEIKRACFLFEKQIKEKNKNQSFFLD